MGECTNDYDDDDGKTISQRFSVLQCAEASLIVLAWFTFFTLSWYFTWQEGGPLPGLLLVPPLALFLHGRSLLDLPLACFSNIRSLVLGSRRRITYCIGLWALSSSVLYPILVPAIFFILGLDPRSTGSTPGLILFTVSLCVCYVPPDIYLFFTSRAAIVQFLRRKGIIVLLGCLLVAFLIVYDREALEFTSIYLMGHRYVCPYKFALFGEKREADKYGYQFPLTINEEIMKYHGQSTDSTDVVNRKPQLYRILRTGMIEDGYRTEIVAFCGSVGEVPRFLPMVIVMLIAAQILTLPTQRIVRTMSFHAIKGLVFGGAVSATVKFLSHRYRPIAYVDPLKWTGPALTYVDHSAFSKLDMSFPCGHSTVTSAAAFCIAYHGQRLIRTSFPNAGIFPEVLVWASTMFYPTLVVVARAMQCVHWPSDAVAGLFLGIFIGYAVVRSWDGEEGDEEALSVSKKRDQSFGVLEDVCTWARSKAA